jgi:hypothetical protein
MFQVLLSSAKIGWESWRTARLGDATGARSATFKTAKATATKRTKKRPKVSAAERLKDLRWTGEMKKPEVPF